MDTREKLAAYIGRTLLHIDEPVEYDENLLASDMVNSLGMLRLIGYIEDELGVVVPPQDFTIANFQSVEILNDYLQVMFTAKKS